MNALEKVFKSYIINQYLTQERNLGLSKVKGEVLISVDFFLKIKYIYIYIFLDNTYGLFLLLSNRIHLIIFFLYSRFSLVNHFIHNSVYMSIPITQFITPPPPPPRCFPPLVPIRLFSISVSQFLP